MNNIQEGDIVYDTKYKEVFAYSRGDRFAIKRLRLATDDEKSQLMKSGNKSICLATEEELAKIEAEENNN